MKIAILGATGGAGQALIAQAEAHKHDVYALARRPDAVDASSPRVAIRQADAYDADSLRAAISGCDAVVSVLGGGGLMSSRKAAGLLSAGSKNLLTAMEAAGVKRLVAISSVGVVDDPYEEIVYRYVIKKILKPYYEDMAVMETQIQASTTDWTIVRPPLLTNQAPKGEYRVEVGGNVKKGYRLSRADLAKFCIDIIEKGRLIREIAGVAY